jgi:cell shape-determining protein MreC
MNYLLDRKSKKKKLPSYIFFVVLVVVIFYFRSPIFSGLSYVASAIFRPVLVVGGNIGEKFSGIGGFFSFRNTLIKENEELRDKLAEKDAQMSNYNTMLDENAKLQEILNRKPENLSLALSAILAKPNTSLYDTLIIDIGGNDGLGVGDIVFALGDVPVGYVAGVSASSSKVILFSNPGEKTEIVIGGVDVFAQIVGRGGGNFEMVMPRDFILEKGDTVALPGIVPRVVATVETIISDPRDSFQKALLVSPVNIFELKFVQVEI